MSIVIDSDDWDSGTSDSESKPDIDILNKKKNDNNELISKTIGNPVFRRIEEIDESKKRKCGEIFIEEDDLFSFLCTLCENPFDQIEQFYLHVKSKHISLKHSDNTSTRIKRSIGEKLNKRKQKTDELEKSVELVQKVKKKTEIRTSKRNTRSLYIKEELNKDSDTDEDYEINRNNSPPLESYTEKLNNVEKEIHCNENGKYSCNECQKEYPSKHSLKRHIFMKHTPFSDIPDELKCNICERHFEDKRRKKLHESIHSGEEYFQCQFCKACFRTKGKCSAHEKTHSSTLEKSNKDILSTEALIEHKDSLRNSIEILNQQTIESENFVDLLQNVKKEDIRIEENEDTHMAKFNEDDGTDDDNDKDNKFDKDSLSSLDIDSKKCNNADKNIRRNEKGKYSCNECQKEYLTKHSLKRHIFLKHTPFSDIPDELKCNICEKLFEDKRRKKEHENFHTGEKSFKCQFCSECFRTKWKCNEHEKTHSSILEKCNKKNSTKASLRSKNTLHKSTENLNQQTFQLEDLVNQVLNDENEDSKIEINENTDIHNSNEEDGTDDDNDKDYTLDTDSLSSLDSGTNELNRVNEENRKEVKGKYACDECEKVYSRKHLLRIHINTKHLANTLDESKCTYCGKECGYKAKRLEHERCHTGEKPFECQTCRKSFRTSAALKKHKSRHNTFCNICNEDYLSRRAFMKHYSLKHRKPEDSSKIRIYQCSHCGISFKSKNILDGHERIHTGERPFSCETCGKSFRLKKTLRSHEESHNSDRPYKCEICNFSFKMKNNYYAHVARHRERRHKCPYCEKAFFDKREYREHITIHTNEKPYQCKMCGEQFRSRSTLRIHVKKHLGIRPFKCEHCDKTFILQSYLKNHLAVHTGAKPFTCSICNESFSRRSELSNHKKIHHQHHEDIQQISVFENESNG